MTQAINKEDMIIERFKQLSPQKQQELLDFAEFLQFQSQKEKEPISAYEAAKEFAGCLDGGLTDISTNKT